MFFPVFLPLTFSIFMTNTQCQVITSLFCTAGLLFIVSMSGCSKDRALPPGMPKLYPCTLKITQEGEPLVSAIVKLHSQGEPIAWTVSGKTDETGTVIIFTDGYFKGAPAGEYKITVDKLESVAPPMPAVLPTGEAELQALYNKQEAETKEYRLVEPVYCKVDSSPLSISIDKKKTEASFDVGKKYRELPR